MDYFSSQEAFWTNLRCILVAELVADLLYLYTILQLKYITQSASKSYQAAFILTDIAIYIFKAELASSCRVYTNGVRK